VEIVTGIDPIVAGQPDPHGSAFLGLFGRLGAFNVDALWFNRSVLLSVIVALLPHPWVV
jgi:hypothetical protein